LTTRPSDSLGARLATIANGLRAIIRQTAPETAAIEDVFHAVNAKTALRLAHVRGVALLVAAEAELSCGEYSPLSVKQAVVGTGRAEKEQVQYMVCTILGPSVPARLPDACDALAVAICHATRVSRAVA
jgi:crossover junction endodeoxyribonuclease RuvC